MCPSHERCGIHAPCHCVGHLWSESKRNGPQVQPASSLRLMGHQPGRRERVKITNKWLQKDLRPSRLAACDLLGRPACQLERVKITIASEVVTPVQGAIFAAGQPELRQPRRPAGRRGGRATVPPTDPGGPPWDLILKRGTYPKHLS